MSAAQCRRALPGIVRFFYAAVTGAGAAAVPPLVPWCR